MTKRNEDEVPASDDDDAYGPDDDCDSCGIPARECGHIRPEAPDRRVP